MRVLNTIDELLEIKGKRIGFFGGAFNPLHFGHLKFIKQAYSIQNLDHIVLCPLASSTDLGVEALKDRLRIMDLILETSEETEIFVLMPEACNGIQSKIFIDDIFYLLKRQKKEVFVLIGCDSLDNCAKTFKSLDVTFIVGCRVKRSEAEKQLIANNMKCVFIDDIIPCSAEELIEDRNKRDLYLSASTIEYIENHNLYWFNASCKNCN